MRARGRRDGAAPARAAIDYAGAALLIVLTVVLTLLLDRRSAEMFGAGARADGGRVRRRPVGFLVHERRAPSRS